MSGGLKRRVEIAFADRKLLRFWILFLIWKLTTPTPSLGFILGGVIGGVLFALLNDVPVLLGGAIFGSSIWALSILWQLIYDGYYASRED